MTLEISTYKEILQSYIQFFDCSSHCNRQPEAVLTTDPLQVYGNSHPN